MPGKRGTAGTYNGRVALGIGKRGWHTTGCGFYLPAFQCVIIISHHYYVLTREVHHHMDKRDSTETDDRTYYFKSGDGKLSRSIIDAVAYVTGKDPLDLEPLYDVVDVDALNALFDQRLDGQVSFEMEGLEVTVTGSEEIIIEDPVEKEPIHDRLEGVSSVLLLAPTDADETCIELLSPAPYHRENVLSVTFSQSACERLEVLDAYTNEQPAAGTIISMGECTRSTATNSGATTVPGYPFSLETIEDATNVSKLGIRINRQLREWADNGNRTVACVRSVTELLEQVDEKTAFKFLHTLTARFEAADAVVHGHMNPDAHDETTIRTFRELFDAVVTVDETGDWSVQSD